MAIVRDGDALRKCDGASTPTTFRVSRPIPRTTPRKCRAGRAASMRGRRSARSADRASPTWSSATAAQARRFADAFTAARGSPVLNDVVLNQVLVSFGDAERTRRVIAAIQEEGTCWCGATVWQGQTAMRVSVISWATTDADVDRSIAAILAHRAASDHDPQPEATRRSWRPGRSKIPRSQACLGAP